MDSFSETQRFRQWWLWLIIATSALLPVIIEGIEWARGKQDSISAAAIGTSAVISALCGSLFYFLRLKTYIDADGISYQFTFFHSKPVKNAWHDIAQAYVRKYRPLREFGGWGVRYGMTRGSGMAYNIAGDMGLQIVLMNGGKVLIGTQQPEAVAAVLAKLKESGKMNVDISGDHS